MSTKKTLSTIASGVIVSRPHTCEGVQPKFLNRGRSVASGASAVLELLDGRTCCLRNDFDQEARNTRFFPSQEKFHTIV